MKQKYVILRSTRLATRDAMRSGATMEPAAPEAMQAETAEIERREIPKLTRDRSVEAIAPPMPLKLIEPRDVHDATPAETGDVTWGVRAVGADRSPYDGAGIVVSVLDTGIDPAHEAFAGVELVRRNFTGEADDDLHGHGTHCAGTIFGRKVGATRIGVATGVSRALIGKVLGQGGGSSEGLVDAILWAADHGAQVVSMSLGIDFPGYQRWLVEQQGIPQELATSWALEGYRQNVLLFERMATLLRAHSQTTLVVAAAGNESMRDQDARFEIGVSPPAVSDGIVSVAALRQGPQGLDVAPFSNTGANVSGPGVGVVSARRGGGLVSMSGTSMATPHVAGVAALWAQRLQARGQLTNLTLAAKLVGSSTLHGLASGLDPFDIGAGLVLAPQD